jgi:hypothetical protein
MRLILNAAAQFAHLLKIILHRACRLEEYEHLASTLNPLLGLSFERFLAFAINADATSGI